MANAAEKNKDRDHIAFEYFRSELKKRAGIAIADNKSEMITGRLRKRLIELKMRDFESYAEYLRSLPQSHAEWELFTNSLTTNKTDFFREPEHFEFLIKDIIPEWKKRGAAELNVWCAAASTGEEPYTLAMVLNRQSRVQGFKYSLLSSDIDSAVLAKAKNGVYPKTKLGEIPTDYHKDALAMGTGEISQWMKIKASMREGMSFQQVNLIEAPYRVGKSFDLIFCRNVLIYFTPETIATVAQGLYEAAKPGAYLVIGHSESLHNITTEWQYVKPSVYRKKG